jgi:hypothetical protein
MQQLEAVSHVGWFQFRFVIFCSRFPGTQFPANAYLQHIPARGGHRALRQLMALQVSVHRHCPPRFGHTHSLPRCSIVGSVDTALVYLPTDSQTMLKHQASRMMHRDCASSCPWSRPAHTLSSALFIVECYYTGYIIGTRPQPPCKSQSPQLHNNVRLADPLATVEPTWTHGAWDQTCPKRSGL